jgi:hypothetical protein
MLVGLTCYLSNTRAPPSYLEPNRLLTKERRDVLLLALSVFVTEMRKHRLANSTTEAASIFVRCHIQQLGRRKEAARKEEEFVG